MPLQADMRTLGGACLRVANRSVAPLDRIASRQLGRQPAPLFVVGLPRSGTTLVYELLAQAHDVAFLTRPYSYLYGLPNTLTRLMTRFTRSPKAHYRSRYGKIPGIFSPAENDVLWNRWFRSGRGLGHYVPPGSVEEAERAAAQRTVASMTAIAGKPFVFKNVYFTMSLQAVLETFPEARFVVVRRPIETVCASVYRIRVDRETWWSIRPPFFEEVCDRDTVEQTAYQCVRTRQLMDREIRRVPADRCLVTDYEDVCRAPREFLDRIRDWSAGILLPRPRAEIPASFSVSTSTVFPAHVADAFMTCIAGMNRDGDQYLARVDEHVDRRAALIAQRQS